MQVRIITHSYSPLLSPSERRYTPTRCLTHRAGLSATAEGECCNAEHLEQTLSTITVVQLLHRASAMRRFCPPPKLGPSSWNVRLSHTSPPNTPNLSDAFGIHVSKQCCVLSLNTAQWKCWEDFIRCIAQTSTQSPSPTPHVTFISKNTQDGKGSWDPEELTSVKETSPVSGQSEMGPWDSFKMGKKTVDHQLFISLHIQEKILE